MSFYRNPAISVNLNFVVGRDERSQLVGACPSGYDSVVLIEVNDEALGNLRLTPTEALLDLAVGLYTDARVTLGRAASIAGTSQSEFQRELGRRGISVHYTADDLRSDVATLASLGEPRNAAP